MGLTTIRRLQAGRTLIGSRHVLIRFCTTGTDTSGNSFDKETRAEEELRVANAEAGDSNASSMQPLGFSPQGSQSGSLAVAFCYQPFCIYQH